MDVNEDINEYAMPLTRQHKEIAELQAERDKLQDIAANESSELAIDEVLKQTRQERRDVTKRHNDLELELTNVRLETSKLDMQLMEAIQQKVAMSVQVEAWESDMQTVLESQMKMRIQEADSCAGSSSVDDVIITQNKQEEQEIQDELLGTAEKRVSLKSQIKLMREELIEGNKRTHEMKMKVDLLEKDLKKKNEELSILTQREIAGCFRLNETNYNDIAANESTRNFASMKCINKPDTERRDVVTKRHNDLELELTNVRLETSKLDMQLMKAIQQKVAMSVQVEAWESDMQTVLESQMKMRIQEADSCAGSSSVDDVIITQATTPSGSKNILRLFRRS
ncbi:PREDICTED: bicaudal D-related protein 2-like [Priapulus caudatus]|uniref:Bicaudal D-related protein 2-like n=1 Tax=Priapulus caudatus TaxID=37621 RepID=A0ABM1DR36_PRICU|nr:PREDICTED: bicaudal D-related protein 2-like [Priapulus caudatus]